MQGLHHALLRGPSLAARGGSVEAGVLSRAGAAGAVRHLHKGHVGATLEKLNLQRHHWLKEVDQAPEKSVIRQKKDEYMREHLAVRQELQKLFKDDASAKDAVEPIKEEDRMKEVQSGRRREEANEAFRMYRLLRPDAPPFYEEDAMLTMQARMNKTLLDNDSGKDQALALQEGKYGDPFKAYLPVVNQRAFLLALESVVASLAEDVETMCLLAGIDDKDLPKEDDPLRFKRLLDTLFGAFPLRKDPSRVDEWMEESWPRLCRLLPKEVEQIPQEEVANWLRGHLQRVRTNQRRLAPRIFLHHSDKFGDEEMYSFAEDFPYDDDPMPDQLIDERNLDFPLEQGVSYMQSLLGVLQQSQVAADVAGSGDEAGGDVPTQFQDLLWDLEKVGLRNWLRMDTGDLERFIPKGPLAALKPPDEAKGGSSEAEGVIQLTDDDVHVGKLMLRCAARGRADLLDFEAVDPYTLLHGLPKKEIEEELATLPRTSPLGDEAINELVDSHMGRLEEAAGGGPSTASSSTTSTSTWLGQGATIDELYKKELDFYRTAGPVEWSEKSDEEFRWKWRQPPNTFWDERRKVYIQEQKGVNPNLDLKEMRQHLLEIRRCCTMVKVGRMNYYRAIIVVGNGKGVYGFGVGFGNSSKEARADGTLKALQNLDYIDMDPGRMLCFPFKGREYKHEAWIIPRPIGRGIKANKKFLPLLYILGLENCKVKFMFSKIFTRIRALKRALDAQMSRRTLANMTGKRYALLVAPGDHWVHWPDRWFDQIRQTYDAKAEHAKLMRRHAVHFKRRGNSNLTAVKHEVRPGWRKENWIRWNNPLERWVQYHRGIKLEPEREPLPGGP